MISRAILILFSVLTLAGCDQIANRLGLQDPAVKTAQDDAEGRAVGGACRQAGRAIEDCYSIYSWLPKASIYEGWRDMDEYMRENKLETIAPQLPPPEPPGSKKKRVVVPQAEAATTEETVKPTSEDNKEPDKEAAADHGKS